MSASNKYGVNVYDNQIEAFAKTDEKGFQNYSEALIQEANKQNIPVENNVETLKSQVGNDLRKNIPPQLYAVVSGIVDLIGRVEEDSDEGQQT